MENFDWKEFINSDVLICCHTEEKANDFLRQAHEHGFKWHGGKSLLTKNNWECYKENTCYQIWETTDKIIYSNFKYYSPENYETIKWKIDSIKEFTEEDLKSGMLIHNDLTAKLGNAMIMPTEKGLSLAYKNGACGNIDFSTITKVWGYPAFFYEAQDFSENHRKLLYEKIKKMTVKEICDKLGYKVEIVEG